MMDSLAQSNHRLLTSLASRCFIFDNASYSTLSSGAKSLLALAFVTIFAIVNLGYNLYHADQFCHNEYLAVPLLLAPPIAWSMWIGFKASRLLSGEPGMQDPDFTQYVKPEVQESMYKQISFEDAFKYCWEFYLTENEHEALSRASLPVTKLVKRQWFFNPLPVSFTLMSALFLLGGIVLSIASFAL